MLFSTIILFLFFYLKPTQKQQKSTKKTSNYSSETLENALKSIENGTSIYRASKSFNIPVSTLHKKHTKKENVLLKKGAPTTLTHQEEKELVEWIKVSAARGSPQSFRNIRLAAAKIVKSLPNPERERKFVHEIPSHNWLKRFLDRFPELTQRKPEKLSKGSSTVGAEDLVAYIYYLKSYFEEKGLSHVLDDPRRVLGGDEARFEFNPEAKKVVCERVSKNTLSCETSAPKSGVSVMHTVSELF